MESPPIILPRFSGYQVRTIDRSQRWPRHLHGDHEVLIVDRGRYVCTLNGIDLGLGSSQILIVKPGDWHEDGGAPPLKYHAVQFDLLSAAGPTRPLSLLRDGIRPEQQVIRVARRQTLPLLRRMAAEIGPDDDAGPMLRDALLREFFWSLVRWLPRDRISERFLRHSAEQAFVARLTALFRQHPHQTLTVPEMAKALGISARTLHNRCRQILGESPARAHLVFRLEEARSLLEQGNVSAKQVAYSLGFANQYHFSRAYKGYHGVSPSRARRRGLPK